MAPYHQVFKLQTEFFSKENPEILFEVITNLLEDQFCDLVSEFNRNDKKHCDEKKFKLNFKMAGHTNTDTNWALDIGMKFLFVSDSKFCVQFLKKSGCIVAYQNQFMEF